MKKLILGLLVVIFGMTVSIAQEMDLHYQRNFKKIMDSSEINWDRDIEIIAGFYPEEWEQFIRHRDYNEAEMLEKFRTRRALLHPLENVGLTNMKAGVTDINSECWIEDDGSFVDITSHMYCNGWYQSGCTYEINLGWNFCFFGSTNNIVSINSRGTISIGGPSSYNYSSPADLRNGGYNHICAYWESSEYRDAGQVKYKLEEDKLIVQFIGGGYVWHEYGRGNTYQVIITSPSSDYFCGDGNVGLCYKEMEWGMGSLSGGLGGCYWRDGGATVGAGTSDGLQHIQIGRFGKCNDSYSDPYSNGGTSINGVYWLIGKSFVLDACSKINDNTPPLTFTQEVCGTRSVCQNNTIDMSMDFMGPELDQIVSITVEPADLDGLDYTIGPALHRSYLDMTFTGLPTNVGKHTITVTATDNGVPARSTIRTFEVEVVEETIATPIIVGLDKICPGGSIELCVENDVYEEYAWSTGCTTQCCDVNQGGEIKIACSYKGCVAEVSKLVEVEPYKNTKVDVPQNPICLNDTAEVGTLVPYSEYLWEGIEGEEYTIYSEVTTDPTVKVGPGVYNCTARDQYGCLSTYAFTVKGKNLYFPNDHWTGPYCDGVKDVVFDGGFLDPKTALFILSPSTTNADGTWQNAFAEVIIKKISGVEIRKQISLPKFEEPRFLVEHGDTITITYYSLGGDDSKNKLGISNGIFGNVTGLGPLVDGEVYWRGAAGALASPAPGFWEQISGPAGSFTVSNSYNTTFKPTDFGMYELRFYDNQCLFEDFYQLEFTYEPAVDWNVTDDILLCPDAPFTFLADTTDIGKTGEIYWQILDEAITGGSSLTTHEYALCDDGFASVTVQNGCGSDMESIPFQVLVKPVPVLNDFVYCPEVLSDELIPVAPAQQCEFDRYVWKLDETQLADTTSSLMVSENGIYTVNISNDCYISGIEAAADLLFLDPYSLLLPDDILECEADIVEVCLTNDLPLGYSAVWNTGDEGNCATVNETMELSVIITDEGNCNTYTASMMVTIAKFPQANPDPNADRILCEGDCIDLILGSENTDSYVWSMICSGAETPLEGTEDLIRFCGSDIPGACKYDNGVDYENFVVQVKATNICGTRTHHFVLGHDYCELESFNVFTPNGDGINDYFAIKNVQWYEGVKLVVYDRWGNVVYENNDYKHDWDGEGIEFGTTYYYSISLEGGDPLQGQFMKMKN